MAVVSSRVCDRVRSQVSLALDSELSQLERAMVESHLRRCASCESFRDDLAAFTKAMREAPLETLERPVVLPSRRRVSMNLVGAIAAAASIAVALGVGLQASDLRANSLATRHVRPAYLDSAEYDLKIIERVRDASLARGISRAV